MDSRERQAHTETCLCRSNQDGRGMKPPLLGMIGFQIRYLAKLVILKIITLLTEEAALTS